MGDHRALVDEMLREHEVEVLQGRIAVLELRAKVFDEEIANMKRRIEALERKP